MLSTAQTTQIQSILTSQSVVIRALLDFDFSPTYELDTMLKSDKSLLEEFIKYPFDMTEREVGLRAPEGYHFHFVDQDNNYYPPEGDALSQLQKGTDEKTWNRVEVRYAIGPDCFVLCIFCF